MVRVFLFNASSILSGFAVRGISAEAVVASRISLERAQEIILGSSSKRKAAVDQDSKEEEEDGGSLVKRPRARRRIISDDEASSPHSIPLSESVEAPVMILDDVVPATAHNSVDQHFSCGFGSENLDPISDKAPLDSFSTPVSVIPHLPVVAITIPPQVVLTASTVPPSTTPPSTVHYTEVGSSSRSEAMRQVTIEVPAEGNLLRKSGRADVWLKPLIGPVERAKLDGHSSLTLMNDIVHASLKVSLFQTLLYLFSIFRVLIFPLFFRSI